MRTFAIVTASLVCLLVPAAVLAGHTPIGDCDSGGTPALGIVPVNTGVAGGSGLHGPNPDGVFYIDDRNFALGFGTWIYEESNGIYAASNDAAHNLQRGGASAYVPSTPLTSSQERCVDDPNVPPDTLIF